MLFLIDKPVRFSDEALPGIVLFDLRDNRRNIHIKAAWQQYK